MVFGQTSLTTSSRTLSPGKSAQLDAQLGANRYRAISLDADVLVNQAKNGASTLNFTITIGTTSFPIIASENTEIFSDDFTISAIRDGKPEDITSSVFLKNYRGTLQNDTEVPVSVVVTDYGISMTLGLPTGIMILTPTFIPLMGQYEEDEYIFHEVPEISQPGGCDLGVLPGINDCTPPGGRPFGSTILESGCRRVIEIAADADDLFMANFGQHPLGQFFAVITMFVAVESAEPVYLNDFDTGLQLTNIRLFMNAADDPYPNQTLEFPANRAALVNAVGTEYLAIPQNVIRRDMAILFTGNICEGVAPDWTAWGRASDIPDMCNNDAAVYVTECIFTDGIIGFTIAHEIGHLLGAVHTDGTDCEDDCDENGEGTNALMCGGDFPFGDPLFMDACNTATINTFLGTGGGCLNQDARIVGPIMLCQGQTGTYTFAANNTQNPNLSWSVSNGLIVNSQTGNTITVTASNSFSGIAWIRASVDDFGFMGGCDPVFRRDILVEGVPATCPMIYRICPGDPRYFVEMQAPGGSTISNISCISFNCNDISWSTSGLANNLKFSVSEGEPGFYFFSYSVTNSCGTQNYTFTVQVLSPNLCDDPIKKTTVQEDLQALALEVLPNPNNGSFTLQYVLPHQARPQISIMDMQGKQVYALPQAGWLESGRYARELNLDHLPSGIYLVKLRTAVGQKTIRMTIQH